MASLKNLLLLLSLVLLTGCFHHRSRSTHDHTPHIGVMAPLLSGQDPVGFVELKLHDDKGDLELWLSKDEEGAEPFDIALDSVIEVTFPKLGPKVVKLRIRNDKENEDEKGQGNIRGKKTNYFIFPGDTGADPAFLVGKKFSSPVTVSFSSNGKSYTTSPFTLRPHTH